MSSDDPVTALAETAALVDRSWVDTLELTGEDRLRFTGGLVTCDVKALAPGRMLYGFFPDVHGKVLADALFLALEDRLWVELPPGRQTVIAEHLEKYIIADRVEVHAPASSRPVSVVGPGAEEALRSHVELPSEPLRHRAVRVLGEEIRVARHTLAGLPAFSFWVPTAVSAEGGSTSGEWAERLAGAWGLPIADRAALEQLRIENGVPAWGQDYGSEHFPQETSFEEQAVDYTKGCYLGQEVIARIHYRGKPNRGARRLVFDTPVPPPPGTGLLFEGKEVGVVGSAAMARSGGDAVGIAVLHRRGWEPGTRLAVAGGGEAEVALLPGGVGDEAQGPA